MDPDKVQDLVTMAFCLEAISEKEDLVSRYNDMNDKTLQDFLIAAINSGRYFRMLADDISQGKAPGVYDYYIHALKNANNFKSKKTINFGLLELMFPTVYARLMCNDKEHVVDKIIEVMKNGSRKDVENQIAARMIAWKTSNKEYKHKFTGEGYENIKNPFDFDKKRMESEAEETSSYQWGMQYKNSLPILRKFFETFQRSDKPLMQEMKESFAKIRKEFPGVKIGILPDMLAAALFLHLSFIDA